MNSQEWKQRSAERILKAVRKAGKIRIRDLKRATHYDRGPGDSVETWLEALEYLETKKLIVIERKRLWEITGDDDLGLVVPEFVLTPQAATLSRMGAL